MKREVCEIISKTLCYNYHKMGHTSIDGSVEPKNQSGDKVHDHNKNQ